MDPIKLMKNRNPYLSRDKNGNLRWMVKLEDGRHVTRARWMMMNFLHTLYIPKSIHVHHVNEVPDDDRLDNFKILSINDHMKLHNPNDYKYGASYSEDRNAYERGRYKNDPAYRAKIKIISRNNYETFKLDPVKIDIINNRNSLYRNNHKDDPEYKKKRREYNHNHREAHKDNPEWVAHNKERRRKNYLLESQVPGYREMARERTRLWKIKKREEERI